MDASLDFSDLVTFDDRRDAIPIIDSDNYFNDVFQPEFELDQQHVTQWAEELYSNNDFFNFPAEEIPLARASVSVPSQVPGPREYFPSFGKRNSNSTEVAELITPELTHCLTPISLVSCVTPLYCQEAPEDKFTTDDHRWQATQSRSRAADQSFLYGVLTTKIYCRPSCASRRAIRKHVRFFPFPGAIGAAKLAMFRPCKRCKPDVLGVKNFGVLGILEVLRLIVAETSRVPSAEGNEKLKLKSLAKSAGLSTFHFHRLFKALTHMTPGDFVQACRSLALQDTLANDQSGDPEVNVATLIGKAPCWTLRTARKSLGGISPVEYAKGAPSSKIQYFCVKTPGGDMYVVFSLDEKHTELKIHAILQGLSAEARALSRFQNVSASDEHTDSIQKHVRELEVMTQDRDSEVGIEILPILWRARLWLRLTKDQSI